MMCVACGLAHRLWLLPCARFPERKDMHDASFLFHSWVSDVSRVRQLLVAAVGVTRVLRGQGFDESRL